MVFMHVFSKICFLCEEGLVRLQLLSVCCWCSHVTSIMSNSSCFGPELLVLSCLFVHTLQVAFVQFVGLAAFVDFSVIITVPRCCMLSDTWYSLPWLASVPLRLSSSLHRSPRAHKNNVVEWSLLLAFLAALSLVGCSLGSTKTKCNRYHILSSFGLYAT